MALSLLISNETTIERILTQKLKLKQNGDASDEISDIKIQSNYFYKMKTISC